MTAVVERGRLMKCAGHLSASKLAQMINTRLSSASAFYLVLSLSDGTRRGGHRAQRAVMRGHRKAADGAPDLKLGRRGRPHAAGVRHGTTLPDKKERGGRGRGRGLRNRRSLTTRAGMADQALAPAVTQQHPPYRRRPISDLSGSDPASHQRSISARGPTHTRSPLLGLERRNALLQLAPGVGFGDSWGGSRRGWLSGGRSRGRLHRRSSPCPDASPA